MTNKEKLAQIFPDGIVWSKDWLESKYYESTSEIPNKWIPVSERLPEKEGKYLTTIFNGIQYIMTCDYHPYSRCWFPDDECASDNVIAWMPLPEPYKAESEDTE